MPSFRDMYESFLVAHPLGTLEDFILYAEAIQSINEL